MWSDLQHTVPIYGIILHKLYTDCFPTFDPSTISFLNSTVRLDTEPYFPSNKYQFSLQCSNSKRGKEKKKKADISKIARVWIKTLQTEKHIITNDHSFPPNFSSKLTRNAVTDSIIEKYLNQARGISFAWNMKDIALVILLYYIVILLYYIVCLYNRMSFQKEE